MIDEKKLIESLRSSLNTGYETFPLDLIIKCIEEQPKAGEWIPVKVRPTTEEDDIDMVAYPWFLDFPLPDEGQEILVLWGGTVDKDTNMTDDGVSYYLDGYGDWAEVDAWMPLPEPFVFSEQLDKGEE